MNRKQLLTLLVLVAVVGGAGLLLFKKQAADWKGGTASGQKLLPSLPINDITHVVIKQGTNELNLAKKEDLWRVRERADYPANYSQISDFLIKAGDLKVVQNETVGASQLGRLELLPPGLATNTATLVEFRDKSDKVVKGLLLGKKQMKEAPQRSEMDFGGGGWAVGRFVMVVGTSGSAAVISDALENVTPKADQWLNKDFFKVEKPRLVSIASTEATNCWTLSRETESGDWKLNEAKPEEKLDNAKASSATGGLGYPSFNDVLPASTAPASVGLEQPTVVAIQTFDGFTYTLKIGAKTNDTYHVTLAVAADLPKERLPGKDEKIEDKDKLDKEFKEKNAKLTEKLEQEKKLEGWVYVVSGWTFDSLLKSRAELMVEKKEEPKKDDAVKEEKPAEDTTEKKDESK